MNTPGDGYVIHTSKVLMVIEEYYPGNVFIFLKLQEKQLQAATEGWEYAPLFNMKFHHTERKMDLVRRRRWHRKMINLDKGAPCFFSLQDQEVTFII